MDLPFFPLLMVQLPPQHCMIEYHVMQEKKTKLRAIGNEKVGKYSRGRDRTGQEYWKKRGEGRMKRSLLVWGMGVAGFLGLLAMVYPCMAEQKTSGGVSEDYIISVHDVLDIHVWKEPELSREVVVREDGKISIPLVDDLQAAGQTPVELKKSIAKKLSDFLADPQVTVIVKIPKKYKVFVTGNVTKPGQYESPHPVTPLQAVAMAGGLNEWASSKLIILSMEGGKPTRRVLNYKEVVSGESLEENLPLKSGDTVIVP